MKLSISQGDEKLIFEKIDKAGTIGSRGIIIHLGPKYMKNGQVQTDEGFKRRLDRICTYNKKVKIFLENLANKNHFGNKLNELVEYCKWNHTYMCLDIQHYHATGGNINDLIKEIKKNKRNNNCR